MSNDLESVRAFIREHDLDTIALTVPDMHGIARGKKVPARRILESDNSPMRMSNLMVMLDYAGLPHPPPENDDRWWPSWSEGYADTRMIVDPATVRLVPWQDKTGLLIGDFEHVDGRGELDYLPRATLKRLIDRLSDLGFDTRAAIEMELMLFNETSQSAAEKEPNPQLSRKASIFSESVAEEEPNPRLRRKTGPFGGSSSKRRGALLSQQRR